jgi:hypothetical protein
MVDAVGTLHPRKLYTMLSACSSRADRARTAFEFLRGSTAADGGFLFLSSGSELVLAASSEPEPPSALLEHVKQAWQRRRAPQTDDSRTLDASELEKLLADENPNWSDEDGNAFERRLLSTYRAERWVPVGIAMLRAARTRSLMPVRHTHVEAICNALLDAGDIE